MQKEDIRWIHRLILWYHGIPFDSVLNGEALSGRSDGAADLGGELHQLVKELKAEAISQQAVDYARLQESAAYEEYRRCAGLLRHFDPDSLGSVEARLAFWINLYNALIIDAVIALGVRESVEEVPGFFWRAAYAVGGYRFSAMDIEHGVLRANAAHPAIPGPQFGGRDPRRRFALADLDPRVHFTLVCAARSCPPISAYSPDQVDEQLNLAARAFIDGGGVVVSREENTLRMSRIFQWYAPDFGAWPLALGSRQALREFAGPYLRDPDDRAFVREEGPAVRFQDYDWSLNALPG